MNMDTVLQLGFYDQNITVMRLLPPEIAFRYHALPIATDGQKVTVAMAASADQQALKTIQQVLDAPVCFIQADRLEIDRRLSQLWPSNNSQVQLLAWYSGQEPEMFLPFINRVAGLLDADLNLARIPLGSSGLQDLTAEIRCSRPDLILYSSCHSSRKLKGLIQSTVAEVSDIAFLRIPLVPLWPIAKILLIIPELEGGTDQAISWAVRFAHSSQALVTVLPVLPPIPLCYGSFLRHNLEEILTGNDPLGEKMREISSHFQDQNVIGVYKMREGDPLFQIREEIITSDPDLIIVPSHRKKGINSWLTEDLGSVLFKTSIKPLLTTIHAQ